MAEKDDRELTEDELEGHARVGAADHGREGDVVGRGVRGGIEADVLRPDRRHVPHRLPGRVTAERVGERLVSPLEERRGRVRASEVRDVQVGSQAEGCVADDELGHLYVGEEDSGLWKYSADPRGGSVSRGR